MHDHAREKNFGIAIFLNVSFTIIEIVGGLLTNSLAILADALHDFGDSIALTASWIAEKNAGRPPDARRTFGYRRLSLLSALFAGSFLVAGSLFILSRAIPRLLNPQPVYAPGMIGLAIVGVIFNGIGFFRLKRGQSMNEKVLSWHLLDDVLGWSIVLIGSIVMQIWGIYGIDPAMTIGVMVYVLWGVGRNLRETLNILMQGVPAHINTGALKTALLDLEGVRGVHDLHVWSLEGENDVFSGHVVVDPALLDVDRLEETKRRIRAALSEHHIEHSTIELEGDDQCSGINCEMTEATT